jgi:hypothetical protein
MATVPFNPISACLGTIRGVLGWPDSQAAEKRININDTKGWQKLLTEKISYFETQHGSLIARKDRIRIITKIALIAILIFSCLGIICPDRKIGACWIFFAGLSFFSAALSEGDRNWYPQIIKGFKAYQEIFKDKKSLQETGLEQFIFKKFGHYEITLDQFIDALWDLDQT